LCVDIRELHLDEIDELLELLNKHSLYEKSDFSFENKNEKLKEHIFVKKNLSCLVFEHNKKLIGYATFIEQFSTWECDFYLYMDCLYIDENYRGFGIGKIVMSKIKEYAQKHKLKQIQWQTPTFNKNAVAFYKSIGAVEKAKYRFFMELD